MIVGMVPAGVSWSGTSLLMILFFFSSRRRHTRFKCDWSSDVCSSDVTVIAIVRLEPFFVIPAVQPDIAYARGYILCFVKRLAQMRLVDITKAHALLDQTRQYVRIVPALVPDLQHQGLVFQFRHPIKQIVARIVGILE